MTHRITSALEVLLDKKQISSMQANAVKRDYLDFVSKPEVNHCLKGFTSSQLSYWLGAALHDRKECMLLLVDRASHRHKFDNRFKGVVHPHVCRVRTDIADLCLNNYDQVNAFENVVTVAKHLCGAATEHTTLETSARSEEPEKARIRQAIPRTNLLLTGTFFVPTPQD
uniref:tRNA:m(4)X modification enzyme TRM13 n=1 Tax=Timema bartmani TaxID=61472 RepID=A0A7R9F2E6_9NEOP|nr:unnamed protein product [Timema bartmani]